jgi:DNA polymerase-4
LVDQSIRGRPYVIAGGTGSRAVAWDVSPEALTEGIKPGTALVAAKRLVKDLAVIPPDPAAYGMVNEAIEGIISRFAPAWQNDGAGNIYLDITGMRRLFGPPSDCVCQVQNEIITKLGIEAAAATASNKLVCKVASRAIRPEGLIDVRPGNEADFLSHQDITLLPGIGPSLMKTIRVTGFHDAGELASLSDSEAAALFGGKKGIMLRDNARGIDNSPVAGRGQRRIERKAEFSEDVLDEDTIRGAIAALVEYGGLEMRRDKLGAGTVYLATVYNDSFEASGKEKGNRLFVLDKDILEAAERIFLKSANRRIRVNSICLSLEDLAPLGYEPDLFEITSEKKERRFQEAIDLIQGKYGEGAVMRGVVLSASAMHGGKRLLGGPVYG